jgi:hypothetical protein
MINPMNVIGKPKNPTPPTTPLENANNPTTKVTLLQRSKSYIKQIFLDYKEVGKDTLNDISKYPFKSLGYGLFLSSIVILYKKNPTYNDYINERRQLANDMIMCGTVFNKNSEYYLNEINKLENAAMLEYRSYVLFSLILIRKFAEPLAIYEKQCEPLNNPSKYNIYNWPNRFMFFLSKIVDIGCLGNWRFLNKNLKDYDVDFDEN